MNSPAKLRLLIVSAITIVTPALNAKTDEQSTFAQCTIESDSDPYNRAVISDKPTLDAIYLEADEGILQTEGISKLYGNVIIQQNQTVFNADNVLLDRINETVTAKGNVTLSDSAYSLKSPSIQYNLKDNTGTIENAEYTLGEQEAHGKSTQIKKLDENRLRLKDATFTSCPVSQESWHLASSDITLNNQTQIGHARNVTFNVGKVPVFYFPWLKFPINNQRLSGFLTPSVRLQTNAGITLPYYFNLAPNYDVTLSLSTLKDRGYQLDTEFRYLTEKHKGSFEYDFIPEDKSFDNQKRDYFKIQHRTKIDDKTQVNLNAENVSDIDYFNDFSTSLESSTRAALQRRLEIIRLDKPWTASAAIEGYQVIDTNDNPYAKLPELKLGYSPKSAPHDLKLQLDSELIYFDKEDEVTGTRADVKLKLSKKWGDDAWYFKPSLSLEHTLYSLDNSASNISSINRTLPTLTLDSGLFFDREFRQGRYTQTIEPRLFYTYTPYEDQSDIPVFDTALTNFSESNQLFLENRFTGKDRIADTNKITFAVSSRIQDRQNGKELFKATIGQVFNFSDRKVTLPGGTISTGTRSDLILELSGRLNDNFRLSSTASLNSEDRSISSYDLRLNYQDKKRRVANISFRKLNTELEQVSVSGAMPINDKWSMVASLDQDIKNNRNLEALAGIEYQDCCWKTRLVMKRYLTSDNINYETPVFLEFELKGLGNIGTSATRQIKEKIYGYDDF